MQLDITIKTGNTRKLTEAMAKELGAEALPISQPVTEPVDILFSEIPTMHSSLLRRFEYSSVPWIRIW